MKQKINNIASLTMVTFITFYLWLMMLVFHLRHWSNNSFWKLNLILSHLFSVQFSHSVMSDSLWSHGLQHARLPCPSPTPGACLNSCPSSQWCHLAISSSVIPFSSCPQSLPPSGSLQWVNSSHVVAKVLEFQL